jgi:anaphase-promoting complex subunit 8
MGHEYVEMKNTRAAIQAYRNAVEINSRDYRAWYGLGQTYEVMHMYEYAQYYYAKAAALRPYDPRMWCAIATCAEQLSRDQDAIRACTRAIECGDREGVALLKLAKLHSKRGDRGPAAHYYKQILDLRDEEKVIG